MLKNEPFRDDELTPPAPLGSTVYERIKADIFALKLVPGAPLQEIELGQWYGVSRTPVREALRQLLDEGFVERKGRFYQVRELSPLDIRDLYEVREALETTAMHLWAERANEAEIPQLSRLIDEQAAALAASDLMKFAALDTAFHLAIAAAGKNSYLLQQLSAVHDKIRLARGREYIAPGWLDRVMDEHRRILSALQRRDAAIGAAEMRYHIHSVVKLHLGLRRQPIGSAF